MSWRLCSELTQLGAQLSSVRGALAIQAEREATLITTHQEREGELTSLLAAEKEANARAAALGARQEREEGNRVVWSREGLVGRLLGSQRWVGLSW